MRDSDHAARIAGVKNRLLGVPGLLVLVLQIATAAGTETQT